MIEKTVSDVRPTLLARRSGLFVLGLALLALVGCAQLPMLGSRLSQVEYLVSQQEFGKAELLLVDIDKQDPDYEALAIRRRALGPLIKQFEKSTIKTARHLRQENQMPQAVAVIDSALGKVPGNKALVRARKSFVDTRQERVAELQVKLSLLQGQQLPAQTLLVEEITALDPNSVHNRWQIYTHSRHVENVAQDLLNCGQDAMAKDDLLLAHECLKTARNLSDDKEVSRQLLALESIREQKEQQRMAQAEQERAQDAGRQAELLKQLKQEYRDLVAAGWWLAAQDKLLQLQAQSPSDAEVKEWVVELEQLIQTRIALGIKQGQALYSQGYLRQALSVWEQTADLAPDNQELQDHIARVERFLEKLSQLDDSDG